jgi:hypothetical protein
MRIVILLATITASLLRADIVTYTVSRTGGEFLYQFILTNTGATSATLFDLFLSLPTDIANIDTATIGTPVGWGDATGGLLFFGPDVSPSTSFVEWAADFSGRFDVGLGNSLSGFSFLAMQPVGTPITFALNGSTHFAPAQEVTAIPEPATFSPLLASIVAVGFRIHFRSVQRRGHPQARRRYSDITCSLDNRLSAKAATLGKI